MVTGKVINFEEFQILNKTNNATQPKCFSESLSENIFHFSPEEVFTDQVTIIPDEDSRFFGARISEAIQTLKRMFKKQR